MFILIELYLYIMFILIELYLYIMFIVIELYLYIMFITCQQSNNVCLMFLSMALL